MLGRIVMLLAISAAWGGDPPPDFSGHWLLDAEASGSMDAVLEVQGVSWVKRKLATTLDNEQLLTQSPDGLVIVFDNILGNITQELVFDGRPHTTLNPGGQQVTFSTAWADDHRALTSSGPVVTDDGTVGTLSERRTLSSDGQTMHLQVRVTMATGASATVTRVFDKR